MGNFILAIIMIAIGYVLGSIPFGVVFAKLFGIGDIRKKGSRSTGATNVMRAGGLAPALLVWLCDMLKAVIAYLLAAHFCGPIAGMFAGAAAVVGHDFSVFMNWHGGKGLSSTFGFMLAANPLFFIFEGAIWLIIAMTTGYSSLAGIIVLCLLPIFGIFLGLWGFIVCLALAILGLWQHRANIKRLIAGEEDKIVWKWTK